MAYDPKIFSNHKTALQNLANKGNAAAYFRLAELYQKGYIDSSNSQVTHCSPAVAHDCYVKAAELGHAGAALIAANAYRQGDPAAHVEKNIKEAEHFAKLAENAPTHLKIGEFTLNQSEEIQAAKKSLSRSAEPARESRFAAIA